MASAVGGRHVGPAEKSALPARSGAAESANEIIAARETIWPNIHREHRRRDKHLAML